MLGPFATASRRTPPVLHCHSPGVATVARRLRIDVYNNDDNDDNDNNDNAWQRGPLWPHGMGPVNYNYRYSVRVKSRNSKLEMTTCDSRQRAYQVRSGCGRVTETLSKRTTSPSAQTSNWPGRRWPVTSRDGHDDDEEVGRAASASTAGT